VSAHVYASKHISQAVHRGDYFLLRNGEFSLSLIREIERLKVTRLTHRSAAASMIREQDLNLAILRASLGTTAQHDPSLSKLRFALPSGPLRPLLPSIGKPLNASTSFNQSSVLDGSLFNSHLLGTPMSLSYTIEWPLDLFIGKHEMAAYATLFSFLSSLRKTHIRVHSCWSSLSNSQRARRKWTGLGEGGTEEDLILRKKLLRRGWGAVRDMGWFLDTLLGYVMMDVVDLEFNNLKKTLSKEGISSEPSQGPTTHRPGYLDFTSIRTIHSHYLDRLLNGCLLTNPSLTSLLESILATCEQFAAIVERWGGDVLPALLFEGSLRPGEAGVGDMVKERWSAVAEIDLVRCHRLTPLPRALTLVWYRHCAICWSHSTSS
jgi:gamma-tubulin complex component 4